MASAAHPRPSGGAYAAPWSPSAELEAEPGESVQLISVRSFLEAPVRTRYHAMGLFEKVRELRRVVALTTEDEASDVVLCLDSRVLLDDYSLEESGVSEDRVVLATRRVRGGMDEEDDDVVTADDWTAATRRVLRDEGSEAGDLGWVCRGCLSWNRAGLERFQCGTANPSLLTDGDSSSVGDSAGPWAEGAGEGSGSPPEAEVAAEPQEAGDAGSLASGPAGAPATPPGLAAVLTADGQLWVEDGGPPASEHASDDGSDGSDGAGIPPAPINGHPGPRQGDVVRLTVGELIAGSEQPEAEDEVGPGMPRIPVPPPLHPGLEAQLLMRLLTETLMQASPRARAGWIMRALPGLLQLVATHPAAASGPSPTPTAGAAPPGPGTPGEPGAATPTAPSAPAGGPGAVGGGTGPLRDSTFGDGIVAALIDAQRGVPVGALLEAIAQPADVQSDWPASGASSSGNGPSASGQGRDSTPGGAQRRAQQHDDDAAFGTGGGSGSAGGGPPSPPPAAQGP